MKFFVCILTFILGIGSSFAQRSYELLSPDKSIKTVVSISDGKIYYTVSKNDKLILSPSEISMQLSDGTSYDGAVKLRKVNRTGADNVIETKLYKKSKVRENYNQLALIFKIFDLEFRAFDNGVAYRFVSKSKTPFKVKNEIANFVFPEDWNMYAAYVRGNRDSFETQFFNSFENIYENTPISSWSNGRLAFLPLMVEGADSYKVNIMESDLLNYPGMFLYKGDEGDTSIKGVFASYPKEVVQGGHNRLQGIVKSREDYLASYESGTSFPWRILSVVENDVEMLDNDLVWLLGTPSETDADWSWVKPGKVAWEWWNHWHITNVDFEAGVNNQTYKHYIDFASKYGIEYVILDEGWAVSGNADLFDVVPEIDIKGLVDYAAERNVGIVLWAGYWAFNRDMEKICDYYSKLGVKGWKIDFMDRDDQQMVDFYKRAAEIAAKYKMFVDFHGAFKPCGQNRTYPNVLNFEGVHGLEQMKWSKPGTDQLTYDVTFPYIRMAAGPVDYTQGAMRNSHYDKYMPCYDNPMSQGTRCHQLGMYVVYDSPFNMLCDTPMYYEKEKCCTEMIAKIPTVWDETHTIEGQVGKYITMARRNGDKWYVGGITGQYSHICKLDLSFLGDGNWQVELFQDGVNAHRHAEDYMRIIKDVDKQLTIKMIAGGGFLAIFSKK